MMGGQSKRGSLVEALVNVAIGYTVNFLANVAILPLFGMPFDFGNFALIGLLYTAVSIARSYIIRRVFNAWLLRRVK